MLGHLCPVLDPFELVEPVEFDALFELVAVVAAVEGLEPPDVAACAIAAPPIADATATAAIALEMRDRIIGLSPSRRGRCPVNAGGLNRRLRVAERMPGPSPADSQDSQS